MSLSSVQGASSAPVSALSGIGLAVLGFALFSVMDVLVKWLSARYPLHQVVFFNAAFALGPVAVLVVRAGGRRALATRRLGLHLVRGLCALVGTFAGFYAFSRMPMADVYAIVFTAPLLITALSVPILKETVGWRRWSAVLAGFVGVLVMLRPGAGMLDPGAFAALVAATCFALSTLIMRRLSTTESTAGILFYGNVTICAFSGLWTLGELVPPSPLDLARFVGGGLAGASAFIAIVNAYRRAPAAIVAPFQYSQMLWGVVYGYLIWADVPGPPVLLGAAIVIGSGLFIIHRETRLARPSAQPVARGPGAAATAPHLAPPQP